MVRRREKKTENVSTTVVTTASNDVTVMTREAGEQSLRLLKLFVRSTDGDQNSIRHVTALLNGSSSTTTLQEEVACKLGAKLKLENVNVTSIHSMNTEKMATVKLQISPDCKRWYNVEHAKTTARFRFSDTQLCWADYVKSDPFFNGVNVDDYNYKDIDLLIGRNIEPLFLPLCGKKNTRIKNGVVALNTKLGWTIVGPLKTAASTACYSCNTTVVNASTVVPGKYEEVSIAVELQRLNDVNALGIEPKKMEMSRKEEREQAALDRTTFWRDGRITVQMMWKGEFA